jgi:hypothetical protein
MRENTNLQILGNVLRPFEPAMSHAMDLAEYLRGLLSQRDRSRSAISTNISDSRSVARMAQSKQGGVESFETAHPDLSILAFETPGRGRCLAAKCAPIAFLIAEMLPIKGGRAEIARATRKRLQR